jgi:hypothetical protein
LAFQIKPNVSKRETENNEVIGQLVLGIAFMHFFSYLKCGNRWSNSSKQLHECFPEIDDFFAAKNKYDPIALFSNKFYEKYGR